MVNEMRIKLGLTTQIIIGAVLGIILGAVLRSKIADIKIIGDIFLRLIQMAVIPLVFCTVIAAIGKLPIKQLGRLGMRIVLWFTITTVIAALVGLILGCLFHPGMGLHLTLNAPLTDDIVKNKVALTDMILGFFPTNIFEALTQGNTIQVIIFALLFGVVLSKANTSQQYDAILTGL